MDWKGGKIFKKDAENLPVLRAVRRRGAHLLE